LPRPGADGSLASDWLPVPCPRTESDRPSRARGVACDHRARALSGAFSSSSDP
jgi:hypothetical protein